MLTVSPDGSELLALAAALQRSPGASTPRSRRIVGITGAPGSGKSRAAAALVASLGPRAASVPMDGFHLADVALERAGLRDRKGAPETFDPGGYAALLQRLRERGDQPVYAPVFERDLEQPVAGALRIGPEIDVVLTEGNYLLLDRPPWRAVRERLDEVWFVHTDPSLRLRRLVARHVEFGKTELEASRWVERVDEPNARLVEETRSGADRVLDLSGWCPDLGP